MKVYILVLSMFLGFTVKADLLDQGASPYQTFKSLSSEEKTRLAADFEMMAPIMIDVKDAKQVEAFFSLISDYPTMSGDDVLENLDQDVINWFYGYKEEQVREDLVHKVGLVSSTPNVSECMKFTLCVVVTKSTQRINVYLNGNPVSGIDGKPVSTARRGKVTPNGLFSIGEIAGKNRHSGRYKGAYLGYAMQLNGHIFIHATSADNYSKLGGPASAGCVRMHITPAEQLNSLMRKVGRPNIRVVVRN